VSRVSARHRKPSGFSAHTSTPTGHRKRSPIASVLRHKSAWAAVTVAGLALVAAAGLAAPHWLGQAPRAAAMDTTAGQHSSRASAQAAAQLDRQAGAKLISSTTAGFSRQPIRHAHRRFTHPTAQPSPSGAVGSGTAGSTVSGPVTRGTDCVASPHACGFPDATNTGANCSSLAPSGSVTVTSNGAVVEGKNISGSITVLLGLQVNQRVGNTRRDDTSAGFTYPSRGEIDIGYISELDRQGFALNPTSCRQKQTVATLTSTHGAPIVPAGAEAT